MEGFKCLFGGGYLSCGYFGLHRINIGVGKEVKKLLKNLDKALDTVIFWGLVILAITTGVVLMMMLWGYLISLLGTC